MDHYNIKQDVCVLMFENENRWFDLQYGLMNPYSKVRECKIVNHSENFITSSIRKNGDILKYYQNILKVDKKINVLIRC